MDLLNLSGDERLDLGDLLFALNTAPPGLVNEITGNFLMPPGGFAVVTGFKPSAASQGLVTVGVAGTPNVAFLGQRIGATVTQGVFTMEGPATQSVSIATFPGGTYGIFVRFNRLPGATQTRKFWSKTAPGAEYSQLAEPRLVATWEMRIELSAPSAEWQQIGQAVVTSAGAGQGSTVVVTDQRPLYFEGSVSNSYAPIWGTAADRSTDRSTANVGSLQRQLDALRACIIDIKGRGLATWYQPNISGMQIGTAFTLSNTPSANTLNIGDSNFSINVVDPNVQINLSGAADYLLYTRSGNIFSRTYNNAVIYKQYRDGATQFGAGQPIGYLTANNNTVNQYAIAAVGGSSTNPAFLGILAPSSQDAFLDFGPAFNAAQVQLRVTWKTNPIARFYIGSQARQFITANYLDGAANNLTTTLSGDTINIGTRQVIKSALPWANGFYDKNSQAVTVFYGVVGTPTATVRGDNGISLAFSQSLPTGAIISATPNYATGATTLYAVNVAPTGNQAIFYLQGLSDSGPTNQSFYFSISYGSA